MALDPAVETDYSHPYEVQHSQQQQWSPYGYYEMMSYHKVTPDDLNAQFRSLDVQDKDAASQQTENEESNSSSNNTGDETEEDPLKLFVGQVPKNMNEEDIFPTFDAFGPLKDIAIIRDKHTGLHRGCAFVTFWNSADAERCQQDLHDKFIFPGGKRAAQVKPAEPSAPLENKLFIGMLSRKAGEQEVKEIFEPFGEIKEIYMIRNSDGSSKCAAFLKYIKKESAVQAIENLNNTVMMEGAARPLIVKFADSKSQRNQRIPKKHGMMQGMGYPAYPPMGMPPHAPPPYAAAPYAPPYVSGASHMPYMYPPPPYGAPYQPYPTQDMHAIRPREGPAGANLFVYHLPHDLTDADLATAFNPFGNVISAKVYVDKYTGESKGFGFVSYDSVLSAETAIEQMNGFQIGNKRLKVQHKRVHGGVGGGANFPSAPATDA